MNRSTHLNRQSAGMTLVELTVTIVILAAVFLIVSSLFLSTSRFQSRTVRRAEAQMNSSQGMSLMTMEIRQAGADPADPQIGLIPIVSASATQIRVRSDLNGDGVLQTTEPSEDVTYSYDAGQRAVLRNPGSGAQVAIPDVGSMAFSYFDATNQPLTPLPLSTADLALVRSVGLTMTTQNRDSVGMTLSTRIMLRNL